MAQAEVGGQAAAHYDSTVATVGPRSEDGLPPRGSRAWLKRPAVEEMPSTVMTVTTVIRHCWRIEPVTVVTLLRRVSRVPRELSLASEVADEPPEHGGLGLRR